MLQFCFVIVDEENRGVGYCLWRRFGKTHTLYLSPLSSRLGGILDEWTSSDVVKIAHLEKNAVGEDKSEEARRMRMERSSQKRNPLIVDQI